MKTFLFRSIIGIFFGAFLAVLFTNAIVIFEGRETLDGALFIKNSIGSILCGWFSAVSPLYFEIPSLKLSQQTALHFVTLFILYFLLAFGFGWIPFTWISFFITILMFVIFYAVIWTCFYIYFRQQAKKLNADLTKLQR
ncbi:DUF3021 domain-containing protein [Sporosarcina pasteurii]|uniref:Protein of uncharacterized function (DUF3021) n=1 Tax=Sporosarcina pasteurii TaxID=1474 RepID=A0A380CKK8_SPOPA|nr:DUF3021 domain-containing protein [Sporosarcina pasteurii]MDS9472064.1 DUF3021 domain-containing protein [Sporosarcina pasteurii]QBQ06791.1 DUF3021 domain-containing protein [Sporosarcina pasteurii]SUJ20883.1 Protein of uncharacterised function (DUF3021) [Sporosarcina pasteurii]